MERKKYKNIKTKELTFVGTLIFCLVLILGVYTFINNKNMDKYIFGTTEVIQNEMFAVLIEDENGEYKEADNNTLISEYYYNSELSGCIDKSGNKLEDALIYEDTQVTVKTNRSVECYLYFDRYKETNLDIKLTYEANTITGIITVGENIIDRYCINNDLNVKSCEWKELNGNVIKEPVSNPGTYYIHVLDKKNNIAHQNIVVE